MPCPYKARNKKVALRYLQRNLFVFGSVARPKIFILRVLAVALLRAVGQIRAEEAQNPVVAVDDDRLARLVLRGHLVRVGRRVARLVHLVRCRVAVCGQCRLW